ncbi:PQQ-dependent sugar dehydrogenase, partial [Citricoccus sp. NPDC055426]|uniref:PQQ-dependent sugar dehydrogenase n=1 Tax=Citricoccus sp. NPDC055426 TaxID=3155536 RepID=UPI003437B597
MNRSRPDGVGFWRRRTAALRVGALATASAMLATLLIVLPQPPSAQAALTSMPTGFVDELVVGELPYPTAMAFTPEGDLFVALKSGEVHVVDDGDLRPEPFIDISEIVHDNDDRGLLGLTIHPEFPAEPYVYLLYTYDPPGVTQDQGWPVAGRVSRLERFTADPDHGYLRAVPGSGLVLAGTNSTRENIGNENDGRDPATVSCMTGGTLAGDPIDDCLASDENSHTIGSVAFDNQGNLLFTNGDGANYNSPDPRALQAQNLDSLSGKVLRIDPLTGAGVPDNPFYDESDAHSNRSKVWSYGLRNPFRMAIHPGTGTPWIGDVGWGTWEEINHGKGANFGWPCYEGGVVEGTEGANTVSHQQGTYATNQATFEGCGELYAEGLEAVVAPVYSYDHSAGGASANAGAFYGGEYYPEEYRGALFITDYDRRWIRTLHFDDAGEITDVEDFAAVSDTGSGPVQILSGPDSNIYWVKYSSNGGEIRRIRYAGQGNFPPVALASASATSGTVPLTVEFTGAGSYDPDGDDLSFSWDFGDGSELSTEMSPTHVYESSGVHTAELTVTDNSPEQNSSTTTVIISAGTDPPMASVDPLPESYKVGDIVTFRGGGTALGDPIPATDHRWEIRLWHNTHMHYVTPEWAADPEDPLKSTGTFEVDEHGDETWYEVCLTVTGPSGLEDVACEETVPDRIEYQVNTQPAGLAVSYEDEGLQVLGPATIRPVRDSHQTLSVAPIQSRRTFVGWSDGETSRSRSFVAGTEPRGFTALYENLAPTIEIEASGAATGPAPYEANLSATVVDPENDELTVTWSDGDIELGTGRNLVHVFDEPGTHEVTAVVTDSLGAEAVDTIQVHVGAALTLPSPWQTRAVGPVYEPGAASMVGDTLDLSVGGRDIWGGGDEFRYVYHPVEGDFSLTGRIAGLEAPDSWAKAGIMLRDGLDASAPNLAVVVNGAGDSHVQQRAEAGGDTTVLSSGPADHGWMRLARSGNVVTAAVSDDGNDWQDLAPEIWVPEPEQYLGFVLSAHGGYPPATAQIRDISGDAVPTDPDPVVESGWVSEMPLLDVVNGHGPVELDSSNGEDA